MLVFSPPQRAGANGRGFHSRCGRFGRPGVFGGRPAKVRPVQACGVDVAVASTLDLGPIVLGPQRFRPASQMSKVITPRV